MKRLKILLLGISLGVIYAFITMLIVQQSHKTVSIGYVFALPVVLGALPVILSTKDQLKNYLLYILAPCISVLTFFYLSFITGFEGTICLVIIVGPFLIVGCLAAFIFRIIKLKSEGDNSKPLYVSLSFPILILLFESLITPTKYIGTVQNSILVKADRQTAWNNIKNVQNINAEEIQPHFIHKIGIPKPINGELDFEGIGATRKITWEKGLKFKEVITKWSNKNSFEYDIIVNPEDIPANTLDEHVMIGGQYFDAIKGGYKIETINETTQKITLSSTYRITSTVNFYGKFWTDYIFNDFHEMILEIIKTRCEKQNSLQQDI